MRRRGREPNAIGVAHKPLSTGIRPEAMRAVQSESYSLLSSLALSESDFAAGWFEQAARGPMAGKGLLTILARAASRRFGAGVH